MSLPTKHFWCMTHVHLLCLAAVWSDFKQSLPGQAHDAALLLCRAACRNATG
jgi:hypothetical protein